ncbi:MAG: hypothetical protein PQJ44_07025 [Sphaerochaetaceae bacterium]|nr:hypothetical protein [Sphaerochaetaceae bacterium]
MKIEVVEFYPRKTKNKNIIIGTLHIYWIDEEMDIRGCNVYVKNKRIHITLPYFKQYDPEQERVVTYPVINYMNQEKQDSLKKAIIEEGKKYVQKYLKKNMRKK